MKLCITCGLNLNQDKFSKDKSRKDGLSPRCKQCKSVLDAQYRIRNKEKISQVQKAYYQANTEKIKQRAVKWYEDNTQRHADRMRQYYQDNKEYIKEKHDEWNRNNKENIRVYFNDYIKQRYKDDINYKVKTILSARLRSCLKNKGSTTVEFLGCSIQHFVDWIEYQFDENMSWNNCGSYWHFDHVRPCSSFNLSNDDQVLQCFNWKNLRPLEAKTNIRKGNKIDQRLIANHTEIVDSFVTRRTKEQ